MVRRGDERDAGVWGEADASVDVEAFVIDRNRDGADSGAEQKRADQRIAGLFDPGFVAGIEQDASGDVEGLLRAGDDHDLAGIAADGAGGAQVGAHRVAEDFKAKGMEVVGGVDAQGTAVAGNKLRPDVEGELVEGRLMDAESSPAVTPGKAIVGRVEHGSLGGLEGDVGGWGGVAGVPRTVRQRSGDVGSGANAALKIALGEELGVGVEDGEAGDFKLGGERAAGGNLLARGEIAAQDGVAKPGIDLAMERRGRIAVEGNDGKEACRNVGHLQGIVVVMLDTWQVAMEGHHFLMGSGRSARAKDGLSGSQRRAKKRARGDSQRH